jgi:hypothetical protein
MPVKDFEMRAIACAIALLLLATSIFAQTGATENLPKFDVVSIKLHQDEGMSRIGIGFGTAFVRKGER